MSKAPRSATARRNWGEDDSQTPILHVDMDAFFVAAELLKKPHLRGKPVVVGGTAHGVVSAASYEARKYGINSAMAVMQARRLCPNLIVLPVDMPYYQQLSVQIMQVLQDFTPHIEQISVDEAFLDVRGARKIFGSPYQIAMQIRKRIHEEIGVPASVGIASTKHLAKIASAHAKPDGILLVPNSQSLNFLHPLPVGVLWGVGAKTQKTLYSHGVLTVGDLVEVGEKRLVNWLGVIGSQLYAFALNQDLREVKPTILEKSISREKTFFTPLNTRDEVLAVLLDQVHDVAHRLRTEHYVANTLSLKIRSADFITITRSRTLSVPTAVGAELYEVVKKLFADLDFPRSGIRLLGVRAENLLGTGEDVQMSLLADLKQQKAEEIFDDISLRFGEDKIYFGSLYPKNSHNG